MATASAVRESNEERVPPRTLSLGKGLPVYHQGDRSSFWYEVVSGVVRTCRYLANGQRHLTGFYYAGEVFGLELEAYRESAESVTDVVLVRHSSPGHSPRGDEVFAKALEQARQSIFLFGHRTAANRVAAFIIAVAERRHTAGLELMMTRSDIADHLNLTLHTVSRTISDFAHRKLIALNGPQRVRILDIEALRFAAGDAGEPSS